MLYADPFDTDDLSRALERALYDDDLRAELIRRAADRVRHFTWDRSARRHLEILDRLMSQAAR